MNSHHTHSAHHPISNLIRRSSFALILLSLLAGCSGGLPLPSLTSKGVGTAPSGMATQAGPTPTALPPIPAAQVHFELEVPANTPEGKVYLTLLDEVTGLALNPDLHPMQPGKSHTFTLDLPLPVGSTVLYRYERQAGAANVAEHTSDNRPVRYRLLEVYGPITVSDVVSRWTDTPFQAPTGRIQGQATDQASGQPAPGLLVSAGGQQAFTAADGSFLLEGLPAGVHNLVAIAPDGSYHPFQQGARVAAESTTPAPIQLRSSPAVKVTFVVKVPKDTPPVVPLRLAGSLYQTGNAFADQFLGMSVLSTKMPVLSPLPDGRYSVTLDLHAGVDLRYKYTLGDGFWNAERLDDGGFFVRELIVPEKDVTINDEVATWHTGSKGNVTFDLHVPQNTPGTDWVAIQFRTVLGWTQPLPMWSLGENRWAYILYGPLNLPGDLSYRYCLNGLCSAADDAATAGDQTTGRQFKVAAKAQTLTDQVDSWTNLPTQGLQQAPAAQALPRGGDFMAGVELAPGYAPAWQALAANTMAGIKQLGANWVVLTPTWTFTRANPLVLEVLPGQDALWQDNLQAAQAAAAQQLAVALFPRPNFGGPGAGLSSDDWWIQAPRDYGWWLVWFDRYKTFLLHHADLAQQTEAGALIVGGPWVEPSLPGAVLANGQSSGSPADAEERWRAILADVRAHYHGRVLWALPAGSIKTPPPFLDAVDGIYLLWPPYQDGQPAISASDDGSESSHVLDNEVRPVQLLYDKLLMIGFYTPSQDNYQGQAYAYDALLNVINQRSWIDGFISRAYYPPAPLQDGSASIHGKPAEEVLRYWFQGLLAQPGQ